MFHCSKSLDSPSREITVRRTVRQSGHQRPHILDEIGTFDKIGNNRHDLTGRSLFWLYLIIIQSYDGIMIWKTAFLIIFSVCPGICAGWAASQDVVDHDKIIVADVDGFPITRSAAIVLMKRAFPLLLPSPHIRSSADDLAQDQQPSINPVLLESVIDQLIDRRVVYLYLVSQGKEVSAKEVELEIELLQTKLENNGRSLAEHLTQHGISQQELEFEIAWDLAWNWYTARVLTDCYLNQYYDQHRYRFDDSEMLVAHLLIKFDRNERKTDNRTETTDITSDTESAEQLAQTLFDRLQPDRSLSKQTDNASGNHQQNNNNNNHQPLDWETAVAHFSQAPSKHQAGEIGWIKFSHPMPPAFSEAAFRLQPGEVSPPVETTFGFHLIRCLEVKRGKTEFRDALDQVRHDAQRDLFQKIASAHRPNVKINYLLGQSP